MINDLAKEIHANAVNKGFYDKPTSVAERIALMHSELSEALEADRGNRYCSENIFGVRGWASDSKFKEAYDMAVKGTVEEEMADIIIRVLDFCAHKNIDIEQHVKAKMRYD